MGERARGKLLGVDERLPEVQNMMLARDVRVVLPSGCFLCRQPLEPAAA